MEYCGILAYQCFLKGNRCPCFISWPLLHLMIKYISVYSNSVGRGKDIIQVFAIVVNTCFHNTFF